MPAHPNEHEPMPHHIEFLYFLSGALEQSPGNADLAAAVLAVIDQLLGVQKSQNEVADLENRLRGGAQVLLFLLDAIVRELEKLEKAYLASPAGKSWTPLFETSAADLLAKVSHDKRDEALKTIDAAVTKADCPAVFKDAGKRFHELHKKYAAITDKQAKNEAKREQNREAAVQGKHASTSISHQTEGHLKARHPDEQKFLDAHFKPVSAKKKKEDPKVEELTKKVADLTAQVATLEAEKKAATDLATLVQQKNGELQKQLDDSLATAATYRQQLADLSAKAASATGRDGEGTSGA